MFWQISHSDSIHFGNDNEKSLGCISPGDWGSSPTHQLSKMSQLTLPIMTTMQNTEMVHEDTSPNRLQVVLNTDLKGQSDLCYTLPALGHHLLLESNFCIVL